MSNQNEKFISCCGSCLNFHRGKSYKFLNGKKLSGGYCELICSILRLINKRELFWVNRLYVIDKFGCCYYLKNEKKNKKKNIKNHICKEDMTCHCYSLADEPDERCPIHGCVYPPRCRCGRFVKIRSRLELS